MAYVITDLCVGTCDTACVAACPVDAIHGPAPLDPATDQLFIDPATCICCSACEPVCPVGAIFDEWAVPDEHHEAIAANAAFFAEG